MSDLLQHCHTSAKLHQHTPEVERAQNYARSVAVAVVPSSSLLSGMATTLPAGGWVELGGVLCSDSMYHLFRLRRLADH